MQIKESLLYLKITLKNKTVQMSTVLRISRKYAANIYCRRKEEKKKPEMHRSLGIFWDLNLFNGSWHFLSSITIMIINGGDLPQDWELNSGTQVYQPNALPLATSPTPNM